MSEEEGYGHGEMTTFNSTDTPDEEFSSGRSGESAGSRHAFGMTLTLSFLTVASLLPLYTFRLTALRALWSPYLPWWCLALAFAAADRVQFDFELRRQSISLTLAELPLTLSLFFCSPLQLVVGRLTGLWLVSLLFDRRLDRKLIVNLTNAAAECAIAMLVFRSLPGNHDLSRPATWIATIVAISAANAVSFTLVTVAMRWHGAQPMIRKMVSAMTVTMITNICMAILAATLMTTNPWALIPFGVIIGLVIFTYRGYNTLLKRHVSLEQLYEFTRLVSGSQRPDLVLNAMLHDARRLLRSDLAAIVLQADGSDDSGSRWFHSTGDRVLGEMTLAELASFTGAEYSVVIPRGSKDPEHCELLRRLGAKDCVVAPIFEGNRAIGMMIACDRETDVSTFTNEDGRVLTTIANHAGIALENGRLIERLHEQAAQREHESLHDPLTGLPNRSLFLREVAGAIEEAQSTGEKFAVALLDLNDFKEVNDTLGHHHGDLLLAQVGTRLRAALPDRVVVARLGGDEFALLTPQGASTASVRRLGATIEQAFRETFLAENLTLEVAASVGFALYPDHGDDPSTLMQRADVAMYEAKASRSSGVAIYDADRDRNTPRRLAFATDLRSALDSGAITLDYQPKAALRTGAVVGVEALARWVHPEYGPVPPDEFIALAERTGLIESLTQHVLVQGFDQLEQWTAEGLDVAMSLNLSVHNLMDPKLPAMISRLLSRRSIRSSSVTFEVTETTMMVEPATVSRILHELSDLGTKISIDDFGTGHSSLSYLRQLPVHEMKIDKSIVFPLTTDPNAAVIVRSIIDLANSLGISVVAEGVEDLATWEALLEMGCDVAQGYFLSRPARPAAFEQWLRDRNPTATPDRLIALQTS
jgi:diguanylate cyclase (GGDEF)-like protein